jgi:AcrR family transcriptional regulator
MARITKSVEERRQEIIDTAQRLFLQNGFEKTQVADISKELNVAQGLVYHYFKSKTEMLYAVIDEIGEERRKATEELLCKTQGTSVDKVNAIIDFQFDFDKLGELLLSVIGDAAIMEYCSNKLTQSAQPFVQSLIEQGNADGSWNCEYPKETARFILQGFSGFFIESNPHEIQNGKKVALRNIIFRILASPPK